MGWIRINSAIVGALVSFYFYLVYAGNDRAAFGIALMASLVIVFGTAFFDQLFFDPSAVFIVKPWRVLRPSAGDIFRIFCLGSLAGILILSGAIGGPVFSYTAQLEGGFIALGLFIFDWLRISVLRVRWHGSVIEIRNRFGSSRRARWSNLASVRRGRFGDHLEFRDQSGRSLKISRRLRGYPEFVRDAERYCPREILDDFNLAK